MPGGAGADRLLRMSAREPLVLDGGPLSIEAVVDVARNGRQVRLGDAARERLDRSHQNLLAALERDEAIYGINTGFGSLAGKRISDHQLREVQRNLLRSHAAGVGEPLCEDVVRGMLLALAGSLCRGSSGVRPIVAERTVALLNAGVTPVVPETGSVGASGDLAPLAHAGLVLMGEGEAFHGGERLPGAAALDRAGLSPLAPRAKEGLSIINGTHLMAARAALALFDIERLVSASLCAAAMSIDACRGTDAFLDDRVHDVRGQRGQTEAARRLHALIHGSQVIPSHLHGDTRVQDPYSLRCAPVALGAAMDMIAQVRDVVERELGAVTDNPLVFDPDDEHGRHIVSAGNFHGAPLALHLDALCLALVQIASISERRVYYMLSASDQENPLNPHLSPQPGLHSGLMIVQYTAAACVNEMATLCAPASVVNIPTSAGMEDFNSFGPRAAAKAMRSAELCRAVVAIELLCAAEALECQRPLRSGEGVERAHDLVRSVVPRLTEDRPPAPDIATLAALIRAGEFRF